MKSVCLAILNYNGRKHLEFLLPTARVAAEKYPGPCSVVVLDNQSTDGDVEWTRREHPTVETIVAPKNDFLFSYNQFAETRVEDIIVFLNNDLKLHLDFVSPLVRHFALDDVFAVVATSRNWDDEGFSCGPCQLESHHGMYWWDCKSDRQELHHTLFCCGGFMAVDRNKFLAIGGFNRLYSPAYCEDVDLSFRAWRKGWRCIFEPASLVWHRENGSWNKVENTRSARLTLRAQLLFQWSTLPPSASWLERNAFLLLTAFREWRRGNGWWFFIWQATVREWREKRAEYRWMLTSKEELRSIRQRIAEPVPLPTQTEP